AAVRISCCPAHAAALRALLPRLDGRHRFNELAVGPAAPLMDLLDAVGLLERWSPAQQCGNLPQVTWLGHAGLLYAAGGRRLVVDPLFHAPSLPPRRPVVGDTPLDWRTLGAVDGIFITHGDNDHLHPESLIHFSTATPLYLPRAARRMAYQVDLEGVA